jgi:hypothetical protein
MKIYYGYYSWTNEEQDKILLDADETGAQNVSCYFPFFIFFQPFGLHYIQIKLQWRILDDI